MRKKNINFVEEIKNSEQFLNKLQTIKKTSQDLKQKNKLSEHRNIWVKEFKYLARLERDLQMDIKNYMENFDHFFQFEIEERQIFGKDSFKNYTEMNTYLNQQFQNFQNQTYKQIQSLPLLMQKSQKINKKELDFQQIQSFFEDISLLLQEIQTNTHHEHEELTNQENVSSKIYENEQDTFDGILYLKSLDGIVYLKSLGNEVKGFDFSKTSLRRVCEGQGKLMSYLQTLEDKLSSDEISQVIEEFNHASNLLEQTYQLEIEKISLDYEEALQYKHPLIENHLLLRKYIHIYQIYVGRGKSFIQYYQRLAIEFPKISKKHLELIHQYIQAKIYKEQKNKAATRNYYREKEELFSKVQKEVNLRIQKKIKDAQKEAERLMRKQDKLKLQKQLEALRAEFMKRQQAKEKQKLIKQEAIQIQEKKREEIRKLYLEDLQKRAEQITQIKQEKTKLQEKQQKIKKQKEDLEKKKKVIDNQPKVQQRHSIQRKKLEKKMEIKEYKQKQKQMNEDRINKAVEQYPFRPNVQFSEERLNAPTQSLIKKKQTLYDKADKIELTKMTGYNVNQLMGDMRFRLNAALQEAGLANTEYARQVINQMSRKPN